MKELLLYPADAAELERIRATGILAVDERALWRETLYALPYDRATGRAAFFARVEAVRYPEEEHAPALAPLPRLEVRLGEPVVLNAPALIDPANPPAHTTFDRLLAASAGAPQLAAPPEVPRKEADLLVKNYMEQGVALTLSGKFHEAKSLFGHALELSPDDPMVLFYLGNILLDTGRVDLALYLYARVIARKADFAPAFDYAGMAWVQKNRPERAVELWGRSLELAPDGEFPRINRAKVRIGEKDYAAAREDLAPLSERNPKNIFVLNLLGVVNANLERLDEAIACWRKVVEAGKDDEYLHLNLARALTEKGDFREALKEYQVLLDLFPEEHEMRGHIEKTIRKVQEAAGAAEGVARIAAGREAEDAASLLAAAEERIHARIELRGAAEKVDLDFLAGCYIEFALHEKGIARLVLDPAAEEEFDFDPAERALVIGGRAARGGRALRTALRKAGKQMPDLDDQEEIRLRTVALGGEEPQDPEKLEVALAEARREAIENPLNEWAHYSLGSLEAQRGQFDAAIGHFRRVAELNPNNALALYALGLASVRLDRLDDALIALQRAVISNPDERLQAIYEEWNFKESVVYFALGDVLIRMGRFREAGEAFRKGLAVDASSALAHFQLGTCQEVLGDFPGAVDSLTNAIQLNPSFAYAYSKLGIIYFKTERYPEALAMLQKAVAQEGNDSETFFYLGETAERLGKSAEARTAWTRAMEAAPPEDIYHRKAHDRLLGRARRPERVERLDRMEAEEEKKAEKPSRGEPRRKK